MSGPGSLVAPRCATLLIERVLSTRASLHGVLGDLEEEYRTRLARGSRGAANVWYWRQALALWWRFRGEEGRGRLALGASLSGDLRYAVRALFRRPGFAAVVLATLALGIGGATTMFTLVHGILVDPLHYEDADRLVAVWPEYWASHGFYTIIKRHRAEGRLRSFDELGAFMVRVHVLQDAERATDVAGPRVTVGFLAPLDLR